MDQPSECPEVAAFLHAMKEGTRKERAAALRDLGPLGSRAEPAIPALVELLRDRDLSLREHAAEVLARIGRPSVRPLVEALATDDPDVRKAVLVVLGWLGPEAAEAVAAVEGLLEDAWLGPSAAETLLRI